MNRSVYFGNQATRLPGPDVLSSLDPADCLFNRPNLLAVPGRPDVIARITPKGGLIDTPNNRRLLGVQNQLMLEHCQMIRREGQGNIALPAFRSFVAPLPKNLQHPKNGGRRFRPLGIVSMTQRVTSEQIANAEASNVSAHVALTRYMSALIMQESPIMMSDIFSSEQSQGKWLLDIEPAFTNITERTIYGRLLLLRRWNRVLGSKSSDPRIDQACERLGRIEDRVSSMSTAKAWPGDSVANDWPNYDIYKHSNNL